MAEDKNQSHITPKRLVSVRTKIFLISFIVSFIVSIAAAYLIYTKTVDLLPFIVLLFVMPPAISLLISASTSKNLKVMVNAAREIAGGNYDYRIDITTNDEFGTLARTLNKMAASVSQRLGSAENTAIIDGLTDLYNHRYFQERLEEEIKRADRYSRELALVLVDIDNFSRFNARNGHDLGDVALKQIAGLIKQSMRNTDIVARYAGEEFVLILPEAGLNDAKVAAQRIHALIETHQFTTKHNISFPLTISMGITSYPQYASTSKDLISSAHEALKEAKRYGCNQIQTIDNLSSDGDDIKAEKSSKSEDTLFSAVFSLAKAVDARDQYTHRHSEFVARYATALGRSIGLNETELTKLSVAGLLHDIGKIGVPDDILRKPDKLNDEEWGHMRRHPVLGADIIGSLEGLADILSIILHHHEKYDGSGYPDGISGDGIPLMARILTVVDSYDAMVSDRPYRSGLPHDIAIAELVRCRGSHFDPNLVDKFIAILEKERTAAVDNGSSDSGDAEAYVA